MEDEAQSPVFCGFDSLLDNFTLDFRVFDLPGKWPAETSENEHE